MDEPAPESPDKPAPRSADEPAPQVSVIIPCWNAAPFIERALDSVLAERQIALECVVADDGSTDGTADLVRAVAERDPRVVLLRAAANEGPSAARNRALRVARGEWLTFLDADDRLLPGAVAALVGAAVSTDALAVVGQRIWTDGVDTWISAAYDRPDIRQPGRKSLVRHPGLLYYASATGKLFHRSCTEGMWFEGRVLGDQPWPLRALLRAGDRIQVIGDVVYEWSRPRPGREFVTITAAKHGSARKAAEAARVAVGALRQVADEIDRTVPDPVDRHALVVAYLDRLLSSDLSGPVARALARRDDGSDELFAEIGAFLESVPSAVMADSRAAVPHVLRPPIERWWRLRPEAQAPAWTLVHRSLARNPSLEAALRRGPLTRATLRIADPRDGRTPRGGAHAALVLASLAREPLRIWRGALRRVRRRLAGNRVR